jgi:hypothetical protein
LKDYIPSREEYEEACLLYLRLVDILIGNHVNIALLALQLCKINLMMETCDLTFPVYIPSEKSNHNQRCALCNQEVIT